MSAHLHTFLVARADELAVGGAAAIAALDRLDATVAALVAERDALRERITRAVAELDAAPDIDPDKLCGKAKALAVAQANTRAWAVLTEGRDPPSRRRAEDAPQIVSENTK